MKDFRHFRVYLNAENELVMIMGLNETGQKTSFLNGLEKLSQISLDLGIFWDGPGQVYFGISKHDIIQYNTIHYEIICNNHPNKG